MSLKEEVTEGLIGFFRRANIEVKDHVLIWSNAIQKFVPGFRRDVRRVYTHKFIEGVTFNAATTTYTSLPVDTSEYREMELYLSFDVNNTPTDIVFKVQGQGEDGVWRNYGEGFLQDLRYEDSAGAKDEYFAPIPVLEKTRIVVTATGTSAANTFSDVNVYGRLLS